MILPILAFLFIAFGIVVLSIKNLRKDKTLFIIAIVLLSLGCIYFLYRLYDYFFPSYKCDTKSLTFTSCSDLDKFYKNCKEKIDNDINMARMYQTQKSDCGIKQGYIDEGLKLGINSCEDAISDLWTWNAKNKTYGEDCKNQLRNQKNLTEVMCDYYKEDRNKFMPRINNFEDSLCIKK